MTTLLQQTVKTPMFSLKGHQYLAKCVKCYDADTIHVVIKFNNQYSRFCCRLLGIDTAEIRTKNLDEKAHAKKARDYLREIILDKLVTIQCQDFDKYGRLLIYVYRHEEEQTGGDDPYSKIPHHEKYNWENSLNCDLVNNKYAYQYDGGTKQKFIEWSK